RGENGLRPERPGFARKDGEYGLRDLFRQMRVADLPHRHRVDEAEVSLDERGKGRFGPAGGELAHQRHVIAHHHLYYVRPMPNQTMLFGKRSPAAELSGCEAEKSPVR